MKKIINGKKYDTDTAEEVCDWNNGLGTRDFHYECETLYRKKTGEFFLLGEGGPASAYAVTVGQNEWSGGEEIIPFSENRAKEWLAAHGTVECYEKLFGEVAE